ncbi:hypothetical protein [Celeribacter litoreus]|uniref:hypothetical protein n=1 Tax=Celeribacter litoreus TaxID=2876714 RepID=UPI001CCC72BC|nr:hypothetical protein [Celeribacter litoreus]MCA0042842.1 hypothetical protein [Celeribacter litoreus]
MSKFYRLIPLSFMCLFSVDGLIAQDSAGIASGTKAVIETTYIYLWEANGRYPPPVAELKSVIKGKNDNGLSIVEAVACGETEVKQYQVTTIDISNENCAPGESMRGPFSIEVLYERSNNIEQILTSNDGQIAVFANKTDPVSYKFSNDGEEITFDFRAKLNGKYEPLSLEVQSVLEASDGMLSIVVEPPSFALE